MRPTEEKIQKDPSDLPIYLFKQGNNCEAYRYFGAHLETRAGESGVVFRVWAPHATAISVVGDFNSWVPTSHPMEKVSDGIWELFIPGIKTYDVYKYCITTPADELVYKADPYAFHAETRPSNGSKVFDISGFDWHDAAWEDAQKKNDVINGPMSIYELHAGSWKMKEDGVPYNYSELADQLVPYIKEMGYTHVELLPITEYPFDGSWGYQVSGYFAPTSRYGTPDELCTLIDACHAADIGVIFDFVPVHFAVDEYGLKHFDGTALYEYPAAAVGESEWGSCNFMHSRGEIRCFLQSAADYWLRTFHADGLRMDAVSRLIYWQGDPARGVNGSTLEFLKNMNQGLQQRHPTAMLIAEDSTNFEKVTAPVEYGGLGFDYKWDLGWMNDTLDYFKKTPEERKSNLGKLTFSMMYFWQEHYILPFSHDENVHGKATILQKMYGEYEDKFPQGRALYLYMAIHPGKMLDFMGNEFGHPEWIDFPREGNGWSYKYARRQWNLVDNKELCYHYLGDFDHDMLQVLKSVKNIQKLPVQEIWHNDGDQILAFSRGELVFVFNFSPTHSYTDYGFMVPEGKYEVVLNTDDKAYGGNGFADDSVAHFTNYDALLKKDGKGWLKLYVPARSAVVLRKVKEDGVAE